MTHYPDEFLTQAKEKLKLSLQFFEEKYNLTEKADSNLEDNYFVTGDHIEKVLSYTIYFVPLQGSDDSDDESKFLFYAKIDQKKLNDLRISLRNDSLVKTIFKNDEEIETELFRAIMDFGLNRLHHRILYLTLSLYYRQRVVAIGLDHSPAYTPFILFLESELGKRLAEYHNFNALKKISYYVNSVFSESDFSLAKAKASFELRAFCVDPTTNVLSRHKSVLDPSVLFWKSFYFDLIKTKRGEIWSYSFKFKLPVEVFNTVFDFDSHFDSCLGKTPLTPKNIDTLQKFFSTNHSLLAMPFIMDNV